MNVQPSIDKHAFDCPHCGAFASQRWLSLDANYIGKNGEKDLPNVITPELMQELESESDVPKEFIPIFKKELSGLVILNKIERGEYLYTGVRNLHLSVCYVCQEVAVWVYDRLLFPATMEANSPNSDLPEDVIFDYKEASRIVSLSPRGAAALLRLAIQKLCIFLGGNGKSIDDDIASLVRKGLLPVVQRSLDSLRVIGNEAVHPGSMDLRDDRETAHQLFRLVNLIADQMITGPKQANEVYEKLPKHKRDAIEERDRKK